MAGLDGHPVLSYQPIKLLFQVTYACTVVVRLPLWIVVSFVSALRPNPKWNAKQTLLSRVLYSVVDLEARIGVTENHSFEPGKEGERFQIAHPAASTVYKGPLESNVAQPAPIGGTWFPESPKKGSASKIVVLHIHGGAFIKGSGRDAYCGFSANTMIELGAADAVFAVQYRLSGWSGRNPFPAALQDSLTAYLFLLHDLGIPSQNIVFCGDSAGGNLVIALLRYIHEFGADLKIPNPRCAILLSPWVQPLNFNIESSPRFHSDFLSRSFLRWGALTYTAHQSNAAANPYITPIGHPFATTVPMFVNVGTAEIFLEVIRSWVGEMKQIQGNQLELHEEDAALHDTFLLANLQGFEESAQGVVSQMGGFINRV